MFPQQALREGGEEGVVGGLALKERRLPPPECLVWGKSSPPPTPTPNNLPPHSCLPHVKPLGRVACGSRRLRGWCWGGGFPPLPLSPMGPYLRSS